MPRTRVKLAEVIQAIELAGADMSAFLDRQTGEVVISDEEKFAAEDEEMAARAPEWQREQIAIARQIEADTGNRFVRLPSQFDAHEWEMMARFASTFEDEAIGDQLSRAIRGVGAFRRFKNKVHGLGVADRWYAYRDERYRNLAIDWCEANEIEWESDNGSKP
jgi:hypothetical protein